MRSHDVVFIFGNPLYAVYGSMWWKLFKKPVGMWYDAGSVTTQMKIATPFLAHVFTATTAGYQAGGNKKHIVGHGIDTHVFSPLNRPKHDGTFRISVVGNIRPAIDYSTMVRAIALIKDAVETTFTVMIAGAPAHGEEVFAEEMRTYVHSFGLSERIIFMGPVKNIDVTTYSDESRAMR